MMDEKKSCGDISIDKNGYVQYWLHVPAVISRFCHDLSHAQRGLAVIVLRLYVGTMLEQQAHYLQRPIFHGFVQRGQAAGIPRLYITTVLQK